MQVHGLGLVNPSVNVYNGFCVVIKCFKNLSFGAKQPRMRVDSYNVSFGVNLPKLM